MDNILEMLAGPQGGAAVNQLASQFGVTPEQAQSAVGVLLPALAAGLQRNASTESGLSGLLDALRGGRHEAYVEDPSTLAQPTTTQDGNGILSHVFGSKDVSRQVATRASQQTGIDPEILKKMLPLIAALAMGGLSRQAKGRGAAAGGAGGAGGAAGAAAITSVLGALLSRNRGGGSMVDDVVGMLGGMLGGRRGD